MGKALAPFILPSAHGHGTQADAFFPAVNFPAVGIQDHLYGIQILRAVAVRPPQTRMFNPDFGGRIFRHAFRPVRRRDFHRIAHMLAAAAE